MISYRPFFDMIQRRGITRRWMIKYSPIGQTTLDKMRDNRPINLEYVEKLCNFFHCNMRDILEVDCDD